MHSRFVTSMNFLVNIYSTSIKVLNGSNNKKWKQVVNFSLEITDLDMALWDDKYAINEEIIMVEQRELLAKWERDDKLSLISIKRTIYEHLLGGLSQEWISEKFLVGIKQ